MILSQVRDYLRQRGQCTLSDIALHFDTDPDAVRGMLDVWVRKGKVEKQTATSSCGSSCNSCDPLTTEIYVWREYKAAHKLQVRVPGYCGGKE
jgi:hypothetical protein